MHFKEIDTIVTYEYQGQPKEGYSELQKINGQLIKPLKSETF